MKIFLRALVACFNTSDAIRKAQLLSTHLKGKLLAGAMFVFNLLSTIHVFQQKWSVIFDVDYNSDTKGAIGEDLHPILLTPNIR
jgi:hypothetical protein